MGDTPLVIRVAANLEELRKNLAEGSAQIESTSSAMRQMATAYDGSRAIAQAGAVMAAIEAVGGVTHLTTAEQEKANAVLEAGLQKYAALGRDAPPGMQAIAAATKQAQTAHVDLIGTLKEAAAAIGLAWSVEGAVTFLVSIAEEARELRNLSLQTQINAEDLQVLRDATKEYGVEGEQLGRALFQLQQRIAGGDASVATAYHLMGMSIDEVKGKDAMTVFLTTERGLGMLSGAIQDTAAKDLYGGRLGASMIAFSKGADEAVAKARALNIVAGTESLEAAAKYADAIDRAKNSLHAWFMEVEGGSAVGFNSLTSAVANGASKWSLFVAIVKDWASSNTVTGASVSNLATVLDHLNVTAARGKDIDLDATKARQASTEAMTAQQQAAQFMAATEADTMKPLLGWQVEYLGHLKDIGLLTSQNAAAIGVNADQLKRYEQAGTNAAKAEAEADAVLMNLYAKRLKMLQDVTGANLKAYGFEGQIAELNKLDAAEQALARTVYDSLTSEKDRAKVIEESILKHIELMKQEAAIQVTHAGIVNAAILAELEAQAKLNAAYGLTVTGHAQVTNATETLRQALDRLHLTKVEGISQSAQEQVLINAYSQSLYDEAIAEDKATFARLAGVEALKKKMDAEQAAADQAKRLAVSILRPDAFPTAASLDAAALRPGSFLGHGTGPMAQGSQTPLTAQPYVIDPALLQLLPSRDAGGPVSAGAPYYVGTKAQPELFIPERSGTMVPAGAGGMTINITVNGSVLSNKEQLATAISDAMMSRLRSIGLRVPSGA